MIFFYSPKCLGFHVQDLLWREMRNRCQQVCYWGHVHCGVCCDNLGICCCIWRLVHLD